jgi:hypothetical protein
LKRCAVSATAFAKNNSARDESGAGKPRTPIERNNDRA